MARVQFPPVGVSSRGPRPDPRRACSTQPAPGSRRSRANRRTLAPARASSPADSPSVLRLDPGGTGRPGDRARCGGRDRGSRAERAPGAHQTRTDQARALKVGHLALLQEELGWLRSSAEWEASIEEDGSQLPAQLGEALQALGEAITCHERGGNRPSWSAAARPQPRCLPWSIRRRRRSSPPRRRRRSPPNLPRPSADPGGLAEWDRLEQAVGAAGGDALASMRNLRAIGPSPTSMPIQLPPPTHKRQ